MRVVLFLGENLEKANRCPVDIDSPALPCPDVAVVTLFAADLKRRMKLHHGVD